MELNTVGSDIEYGSILGGNRDDYGYAISVDDIGNAYLTGSTNSPDFPNGFSVSPDFIPLEDAFQIPAPTVSAAPAGSPSAPSKEGLIFRLKQLKELFNAELITEEEYAAKKKEILDKL